MGKYYYLVAGLANLDGDDGKPQLTLEDFRSEVLPQVSASDRRLLELPSVEADCRRLAAFLEDRSVPETEQEGLLTAAQLEDAVSQAKSGESRPDYIPVFMWECLCSLLQQDNGDRITDRLLAAFYEYAIGSDNAFVSDWYRFNMDLGNVQTAMAARKYGLEVQKLVVGDSETAKQLCSSGARDWGLSGELDFLDELQRISDEQDLARREHLVDMMRWKWLEENSFFSFFSVEYLFSYMERLSIAWRWNSLDHEGGEKILRGLIGELKGQVQVPDGFDNN